MYMAQDTSRGDALQTMLAYVEGPKVRNVELEPHFGLAAALFLNDTYAKANVNASKDILRS
jgi:hypothetical protein